MKKKVKQNNGITLVSLVVTIVILILLAGVSIHLILGKNGMIPMAEKAKKDAINAEQEENNALEKLYSSILIATNDASQITINVEDLQKLIENQVNEKTKDLQNKVEEISNQMKESKKMVDTSNMIKNLSLNTLYTVEEDCIFTGSANMLTGTVIGLDIDGKRVNYMYYNGNGNVGASFPSMYLKKGSSIKIFTVNAATINDYSFILYGLK